MAKDDLTPEQRRLVKQAQGRVADPETQRRLRESSEALARNPQFVEMTSSLSELGPRLDETLSSFRRWWSSINFDGVLETLRAFGEAFARSLPPNAEMLGVDRSGELYRLAAEEQLCLSWVPDGSLARALVECEDSAEREKLLLASSEQLLQACRKATSLVGAYLAELADDDLEGFLPPELSEIAELMGHCVDAAVAGHHEAAQALATCVIDTILEQRVNGSRRGSAHTMVKRNLRESERWALAALVMGPTLAAVESSFRQPASWETGRRDQKQTASSYGRNATVHAASRSVFSEVSSLKAILLATSLVRLVANPLFPLLLEIVQSDVREKAERSSSPDQEGKADGSS